VEWQFSSVIRGVETVLRAAREQGWALYCDPLDSERQPDMDPRVIAIILRANSTDRTVGIKAEGVARAPNLKKLDVDQERSAFQFYRLAILSGDWQIPLSFPDL